MSHHSCPADLILNRPNRFRKQGQSTQGRSTQGIHFLTLSETSKFLQPKMCIASYKTHRNHISVRSSTVVHVFFIFQKESSSLAVVYAAQQQQQQARSWHYNSTFQQRTAKTAKAVTRQRTLQFGTMKHPDNKRNVDQTKNLLTWGRNAKD